MASLEATTARRRENVAIYFKPRHLRKSLLGNLAGSWRYRVCDSRNICDIHNDEVVVLVIKLGTEVRFTVVTRVYRYLILAQIVMQRR